MNGTSNVIREDAKRIRDEWAIHHQRRAKFVCIFSSRVHVMVRIHHTCIQIRFVKFSSDKTAHTQASHIPVFRPAKWWKRKRNYDSVQNLEFRIQILLWFRILIIRIYVFIEKSSFRCDAFVLDIFFFIGVDTAHTHHSRGRGCNYYSRNRIKNCSLNGSVWATECTNERETKSRDNRFTICM